MRFLMAGEIRMTNYKKRKTKYIEAYRNFTNGLFSHFYIWVFISYVTLFKKDLTVSQMVLFYY